MENKKQLSLLFEMIRFPLMLLVVYVHMLPFEAIKIELELSSNNVYVFLSEMISHIIGQLPVPIFFIISSYYFFNNMKRFTLAEYSNKLHKRVFTLLIPYIAWNILIVLATIVVNYVGELFLSREKNQLPSIFYIFWDGPANFPLWYVRNLMVMLIASPLVYYYIKATKWYGLLLLFILFIFFHALVPNITTILFFTLGSYLAINDINIISFLNEYKKRIGILSIILLLAATITIGQNSNSYLLGLFIIVGIITTMNIFNHLSNNNKIKDFLIKLAPTGFFIYVAHEIFIINWIKGIIERYSILSTGIGKIISYFIGPIICVIICIAIFNILNRIMPKTLNFITGQRGGSIGEKLSPTKKLTE